MTTLTAACVVEPCDHAPTRRGMCVAHYNRWYRSGDPGPAEVAPRVTSRRFCEIPGCDSPRKGDGLCELHYTRRLRTGHPLGLRPLPSLLLDTNPSWKGDRVSYSGAHRRVKRLRGPASSHSCVTCGVATAEEWAYDHTAEVELICAKTGFVYCGDPTRYQPMCRKCHKAFDRAHE